MASLIPMRPKSGKFNLAEEEKDGLTYYVLSGCQREAAFLKFIRPDFIGTKSPATLKAVVSQFFAGKDAKDYIEAYKRTIEEAIAPKEKPRASVNAASIEERKSKALSKLVEYVLSESDKIGTEREGEVDVKSIMDFANRIGIFDQQEEVEEVPRRYLPEVCSECAYRKFVEENCEEVEDNNKN